MSSDTLRTPFQTTVKVIGSTIGAVKDCLPERHES